MVRTKPNTTAGQITLFPAAYTSIAPKGPTRHEDERVQKRSSYEQLTKAAGRDLFGLEMQTLLQRLHSFAFQVHYEKFGSVTETVAGAASTELVENMAQVLSQDLSGRSRAIASKSLQETFLYCTGVHPDLPRPAFGKSLETFLERHGSKGLIWLFLKLHLFNLIWIDLLEGSDEAGRPTDPGFKTRMQEIERICDAAATASVRSWKKWPQLSVLKTVGRSASAAASALKT